MPFADTIIAAPLEASFRSPALIHDGGDSDWSPRQHGARRVFKIRTAESEGCRSSAGILIDRRYAWRGYHSTCAASLDEQVYRVTLLAVSGDEAIGTLSIGFDGPGGLLVDELFAAEVHELRDAGRTVCEFTKLAVDTTNCSKRVIASLFHVAHVYAHHLGGADSLLIEVNPRHVSFYKRMLGFEVMSGERTNRRVSAPAVLLHLDLHHTCDQIDRFGGRPELTAVERSLYPYAFSSEEEAAIVERLAPSLRGVADGASGVQRFAPLRPNA